MQILAKGIYAPALRAALAEDGQAHTHAAA